MGDHSNDSNAGFFKKLRWAKIVTWAFFLGLVYILSSFFTVIFLTFVISYIARNVVELFCRPFTGKSAAQPGPRVRKAAVVLTFILFLFLFYSVGRLIAPQISEQGMAVSNVISELARSTSGNDDRVIPRIYAGIRFLLFKTTDEYEKGLSEFQKEKEDKSGWPNFLEKAGEVRNGFREKEILRRGEEVVGEWEKQTEEFDRAFEDALPKLLEEREYLSDKEKYDQGKEADLYSEYGPNSVAKLMDRPDWPEYLKRLVIDDLLLEVKTDAKKEERYRILFRQNEIRREGNEAVKGLEGTPSWEELFKKYYERLSDADKDYSYEKFIELEMTKDQEEFQEKGGGSLSEEKLAAQFRKMAEDEFVEDLSKYDFITDLDKMSAGEIFSPMGEWMASAIKYLVTFAFHLVLSVFFSFIIVWDIPKLAGTIRRLESSRISDFYKEIAPGLVSFGSLMGRAFQAQAVIALMNTMLTLVALSIFQVENSVFLCAIVFLCSFIPVVGVIISSVPIALVCLQQPGGGIILALEMIAAIIVIHFIEATILNPKVMGDMLKLHPLLVLIILMVGEHFFGVWGLLLGVPVCVYIFRYVILKDEDANRKSGPPEPALAPEK